MAAYEGCVEEEGPVLLRGSGIGLQLSLITF